eukprot:260796-Amphidinium_carterae.1
MESYNNNNNNNKQQLHACMHSFVYVCVVLHFGGLTFESWLVTWDMFAQLRRMRFLATPKTKQTKSTKLVPISYYHCAKKHYISNSKRLGVGNCNH